MNPTQLPTFNTPPVCYFCEKPIKHGAACEKCTYELWKEANEGYRSIENQ